MSTKPLIYVDSCCFIEAVKHRVGLPLSTTDPDEIRRREEDCWYFRRLCDASRDGAIHLHTSTLSVAECLHAGEPDGPSQAVRDLFVQFLTSGTIVDLIEPDLFVAERARDLLWNDKILLSGADSLHVASALIGRCTEFLTLDGKIRNHMKFAAAIPRIAKIGLRVVRPSQTSNLPGEYRTDDLFKSPTAQASSAGTTP
jgi:hypothetical protein